jgi:hypothetical protein
MPGKALYFPLVNVLVHVNVPDTGFKGAEVIAWKG